MGEKKTAKAWRGRVSADLYPYVDRVRFGLELIKLKMDLPSRDQKPRENRFVTINFSTSEKADFDECIEMFDVTAPQLIEAALITVQRFAQRDLS